MTDSMDGVFDEDPGGGDYYTAGDMGSYVDYGAYEQKSADSTVRKYLSDPRRDLELCKSIQEQPGRNDEGAREIWSRAGRVIDKAAGQYSTTMDKDELDDAASEAREKVYKLITGGKFDGRCMLEAWLKKIVANVFNDECDKLKRERRTKCPIPDEAGDGDGVLSYGTPLLTNRGPLLSNGGTHGLDSETEATLIEKAEAISLSATFRLVIQTGRVSFALSPLEYAIVGALEKPDGLFKPNGDIEVKALFERLQVSAPVVLQPYRDAYAAVRRAYLRVKAEMLVVLNRVKDVE